MSESIKKVLDGSRAERRRDERDLEKGLNPDEKAYIDMVENNGKQVSEKLMKFREETAALGYQVIPVLNMTPQGVFPLVEIQALPFSTYIKLKSLKEASGNEEEATKEEDKTIDKIDENVKEAPVYPH